MHTIRKGKFFVMAAIGLALILVLSACARGGEPTPTPVPTPTPTPAPVLEKHIEMLAYNWGYDPATIVVQKGTEVHLTITVLEHEHAHDVPEVVGPDGTVYHHGFALSGYPVAVQLPLGETEVTFMADKAGEFPFMCTAFCGISEDGITGHHTMNGKLVVFEGENPPAGYTETPDGYHFSEIDSEHDSGNEVAHENGHGYEDGNGHEDEHEEGEEHHH